MQTSVDDVWTGTDPKTEDKVKDIFEVRIRSVNQDFQSASARPDKAQAALGVMSDLQKLLDSAAKNLATARAVAPSGKETAYATLASQLADFCDDVRLWRYALISLTSGEATSNARTRFGDAGFWAMHFSVVRMTVATFFITAAWSVVSLKWNDYTPALCFAALAVWTLAGIFLWFFTRQIVSFSEKQKVFQSEIPTVQRPSTNSTMRKEARRSIWAPFILFLFMSAGFWTLLHYWAAQNAKSPVSWGSIYAEASPPRDQSAAIKEVSDKLDKLINPAASPTPSVTSPVATPTSVPISPTHPSSSPPR